MRDTVTSKSSCLVKADDVSPGGATLPGRMSRAHHSPLGHGPLSMGREPGHSPALWRRPTPPQRSHESPRRSRSRFCRLIRSTSRPLRARRSLRRCRLVAEPRAREGQRDRRRRRRRSLLQCDLHRPAPIGASPRPAVADFRPTSPPGLAAPLPSASCSPDASSERPGTLRCIYGERAVVRDGAASIMSPRMENRHSLATACGVDTAPGDIQRAARCVMRCERAGRLVCICMQGGTVGVRTRGPLWRECAATRADSLLPARASAASAAAAAAAAAATSMTWRRAE
jgi:hypothetical protein